MKKFFGFVTLILSVSLFCQTINRAYYKFTYKPNLSDTLKKRELQVLIFDNEKSTFQSHKVLRRDSLFATSLAHKEKTGYFLNNDQLFFTPIDNQYIITTNIKNQELIFKDIIGDQYVTAYKEKIKLVWKLEKEVRKISDVMSQKATTEFGGRKWVAWFSTEHQFNFGPYKFFGLPGLILKVSDVNNEFDWELKGLKKENNYEFYEKTYLELQNFPLTTLSKSKFLQLEKYFKENPLGNIKEIFPNMSGEELKKMLELEKEKLEKNKYLNNPIEL